MYHTIGCEATMACKDQEKQNKEMAEQHLSLSVTELATTKKELEEQLSASRHTIHDHDLLQKKKLLH